MYTLLSGIYRQITRKEEYNVLIIGLDNAGKTTLLEKIKTLYTKKQGLPPEKIAPTVGLNVAKIVNSSCIMHFWDLGGQRELRRLWKQYYSQCHGIFFVMDSTDSTTKRLEEVQQTIAELMMNQDLKEMNGIPILLLANKQDVSEALSIAEIKDTFNQIALQLEARQSNVLGISALNGLGVDASIQWILSRMLLNKETRPPHFET